MIEMRRLKNVVIFIQTILSKDFERLVCWNEYEAKSENKNTANEIRLDIRYFFESNFVGVNGLFVSVYSNHDNNAKRFKAKRYYLPKGIIDYYNVIFNRIMSSSLKKTLMINQLILMKKELEEIKK